MSSHSPSLRAALTTRTGALALSLMGIELLAGMQTYLSQTIAPLLAEDLHGRRYYGVTTAASQVAVFVTLPLGAWLMRRHSPARLIALLTPVSVAAGLMGSLAPHIWVYIASRVVAGLASGALASVGMGAVVTGLPSQWRQLVLAGNNAVWVISAIVGPAYAAWLSAVLSWRWALVAYLPLLVIARYVVARALHPHAPAGSDGRAPVALALAMAGGVAALSAFSLGTWWGWVIGFAGAALAVGTAARLLPGSVVRARPGAGAGVMAVGCTTALLAGADAISPLIAHDLLGMDEVGIGVVIAASGLGWALVGLWTGRFPATGRRYARRGYVSAVSIGLGLAGSIIALMVHRSWLLVPSYALVGMGVGWVYIDSMNAAFTPDDTDPMEPTDASTGVVLVEQLGWAVPGTITASLFAAAPHQARWILAGLIVGLLPMVWVLRRASRTA